MSWRLDRGAVVEPDGAVRFAAWAPYVERMRVRFPNAGREIPMARSDDGLFEVVVPDVPPGSDYLYRLDGGRDRPDPVSRHQPLGIHGPSRVVDPGPFRWSDEGWTGIDTGGLAVYEMHVGTFTAEGTLDAAGSRLEALRDLGITAVELMPVAEFAGARNWGYDGVLPYATHHAYGGPDALRRFVDRAHAEGLGVILDVVYNHFGPEGNYLGEFGPYFTDRYRTPWGPAVNFDGPHSDDVRKYVIDNACAWVVEYHLDGLRIDAVHAIFDFSARHILDELAAAVHAAATDLGRRALVIAESDLNDPRLVRPAERGGYGLDAQWNDDFHHAVHAALTSERMGYYADFGGVGPIAHALERRFVLDGRYSAYRRRRHGAPADDVPADRFVVFVQNHDQVGNRAGGERLSTLVSFEAQKLAAALLLWSPYVPLLFMGEEYGETNPFLYFVSHGDPALVEAVRTGRRREFAAFGWRTEPPDPQATETFERSKLAWQRATGPRHDALRRLYRDLLCLRREEPALRPGGSRALVRHGPDQGWLTVHLTPRAGAPLLAVFNVSDAERDVPVADPGDGGWAIRSSTDHPAYDGSGRPAVAARREREEDGVFTAVPGRCAHLFRWEAA